MLKFVLLSCLVVVALASPHHAPGHQHDEASKEESVVKPADEAVQEVKDKQEVKPAEAASEALAKPVDAVKESSDADTVRKEVKDHHQAPLEAVSKPLKS